MVLPLQDQNVSQCEILNTIATRKTLIQYYGNVLLHPVNNFKFVDFSSFNYEKRMTLN